MEDLTRYTHRTVSTEIDYVNRFSPVPEHDPDGKSHKRKRKSVDEESDEEYVVMGDASGTLVISVGVQEEGSDYKDLLVDENDCDLKRSSLDYRVVNNASNRWFSTRSRHGRFDNSELLREMKIDIAMLQEYVETRSNDWMTVMTEDDDDVTSVSQDYEVYSCGSTEDDFYANSEIISSYRLNYRSDTHRSSEYELHFPETRFAEYMKSRSYEFDKSEFRFTVSKDSITTNSREDNSSNYAESNEMTLSRSDNEDEILSEPTLHDYRQDHGFVFGRPVKKLWYSEHNMSEQNCQRRCLDVTRHHGPKSCTTHFYNENNLLFEDSEPDLQKSPFTSRINELQCQLEYFKDSYYLNKKFNNEIQNKYGFNRNNVYDTAVFSVQSSTSSCFDERYASNRNDLMAMKGTTMHSNKRALRSKCSVNNKSNLSMPDLNNMKRKTVEVLFPVKSHRNRSASLDCTNSNNNGDYFSPNEMIDHTEIIKEEERECIINYRKSNHKFVDDRSVSKTYRFVNTSSYVNSTKSSNYTGRTDVKTTLNDNPELKEGVVNILEDFLKDNILVSNVKGVNYNVFFVPKDEGAINFYSGDAIEEEDFFQGRMDSVYSVADEGFQSRYNEWADEYDRMHRNRQPAKKKTKKKPSSTSTKRQRHDVLKVVEISSENSYNIVKGADGKCDVTSRFHSLPLFNITGLNNNESGIFGNPMNGDFFKLNLMKSNSLNSPAHLTADSNRSNMQIRLHSYGDSRCNNLVNVNNNTNNKIIKIPKPRKRRTKKYEVLNELDKFKEVLNEVECRQNALIRMLCCDPCGFTFRFPNESKMFW